ncbi:hypothetical protein Tco_0589294 [Tanacetum coccineum]
MVEKNKLDEDLQGTPVDATYYHVIIGSLMYLTSSRPDLIYAVCLCAQYQVKPTEKHLQAVKRIFRYLKGTIHMVSLVLKVRTMTTTAAKQVALDNALVPLEKRVEIGKCNMRIDPTKTQKEPTYQVVLDALALTTCYPAILITADVLEIYMQQYVLIFQIKNLMHFPQIKKLSPSSKNLDIKGDIKSINEVVVNHMPQILWECSHKKKWTLLNYIWVKDFTLEIENQTTRSKQREEGSVEGSEQQSEGNKDVKEKDSDDHDKIINLQQWVVLVRQESSVDITPSVVKAPIYDWKIFKDKLREVYQIFRVGQAPKAYPYFEAMLKEFDRDDMVTLWKLVKDRFKEELPKSDLEKCLFWPLKVMFEPVATDGLWQFEAPIKSWRLYKSCRVHCLIMEGMIIYMLDDVEYPLPKTTLQKMLDHKCEKVPPEEPGKAVAGEASARKKGRTVAITTKDMQKRRNDVKARTTLLLALPDEHQLRFSKYDNVKELWEAILKTFGGNEATKKTKKNQLKQQYGNFKAKGSETLEQTFNRLQAIVSHLEFMDVPIEKDDLNQKFLTSLAPEWLMYTIVWRNRDDLDTMSLDDLYNHLKVYKPEVQKKAGTNSQNMAFISSSNTSNGKGEVPTASVPNASSQVSTISTEVAVASLSYDTICAYIATQSSGSQINYEDITQIDEDDIEEMDIK